MNISKCVFKKVLRYSPQEKKLRLFRVLWTNPIIIRESLDTRFRYNTESNCKLSFSIVPQLLSYRKTFDGYRFSVLFIHVHYRVSHSVHFV